MTTYEIRTSRGRPVFAYDSITRAQAALDAAEKRLRIPLRLFEIRTTESEVERKGQTS